VWCHWCHVMDEITYRDPKVIELIRSHYIPVWVDEDSGLTKTRVQTSQTDMRITVGRRRSPSVPTGSQRQG
jgi:hypothetical protein